MHSDTEQRRRAAVGYIRGGLAVIPVPAGEKNPGRPGWQELRITEDEVERYWTNGQNVGILCGEPSGWLVDVDLDTDEAVELAGRFLPPTLTSGRERRPHSHWWYRCAGAESRDYTDVDNVTKLIELRSSGRQTIVAPSTHPVGDRYVWHRESGLEAAEVSAAELEARLRELATATLIARHMPEHREFGGGGRHDYALALAGFLLRPGRLDTELARKLLLAAWSVVSYPNEAAKREALRDVENVVSSTLERLEAGDPVTGGGALEAMRPGMVKALCKWWGWDRRDEAVREFVPEPRPWPVLAEEAYYGLAGEIVRAIEPHTEADPAAVLVNLLAAFGNVCGRGVFARVTATEHHMKLFAGLVGETSKGRKGESWGPVRLLLRGADEHWADERVATGLSSGEGLIHAVRDEVRGMRKDEEVVLDPGESDKRLFVLEAELANVLKVMGREGNTLSPVIRLAWDGDRLRTMTKNSPTRATGAHVSLVGHITKDELLRHLNETEAANGFANRFLWVMVRRSKKLPYGGEWDAREIGALSERLRAAVAFGRTPRRIDWGESARPAWEEVYGPLSEGKPGLFGAVVGRAEAQVLRLATIYAVLDRSATREYEHLAAALALWEYAEESARYIFGDATGDAVADQLYEALRVAGKDGLSRTEIRDLFGRNMQTGRINQALGLLLQLGRVRREKVSTGGRPQEKWTTNER